MARYLISGVWKDNADRITHVMLHKITQSNTDGSYSFDSGRKLSESDVITLWKAGNKIHTIVWNYPGWNTAAEVIAVKEGLNEYLRTVPDATKKNNLDNSINMQSIA